MELNIEILKKSCIPSHMNKMNQHFETAYSYESLCSEDIFPKNQVNTHSIIQNFLCFKYF